MQHPSPCSYIQSYKASLWQAVRSCLNTVKSFAEVMKCNFEVSVGWWSFWYIWCYQVEWYLILWFWWRQSSCEGEKLLQTYLPTALRHMSTLPSLWYPVQMFPDVLHNPLFFWNQDCNYFLMLKKSNRQTLALKNDSVMQAGSSLSIVRFYRWAVMLRDRLGTFHGQRLKCDLSLLMNSCVTLMTKVNCLSIMLSSWIIWKRMFYICLLWMSALVPPEFSWE